MANPDPSGWWPRLKALVRWLWPRFEDYGRDDDVAENEDGVDDQVRDLKDKE